MQANRKRFRRAGFPAQKKLLVRLVFAILLVIVGAFVLIGGKWASSGRVTSAWRTAVARPALVPAARVPQGRERPIYPFSIVAGGVRSRAEFQRAIRTDPVVAAHYAGFNPAAFRLVKLKKPEYAYVSFRIGDNIYWTSHRVELRQGEMLISDGRITGRTRCGNQVSQVPRLPTYSHEPSDGQLNAPISPKIETEAFTAERPALAGPGVRSAPLLGMVSPLAPHPAEVAPVSAPPGSFNPLAQFSVLPSCSGNETEVDGKCETPQTPPDAPTPESATWVLLLSGGLVLAAGREIQRRLAD